MAFILIRKKKKKKKSPFSSHWEYFCGVFSPHLTKPCSHDTGSMVSVLNFLSEKNSFFLILKNTKIECQQWKCEGNGSKFVLEKTGGEQAGAGGQAGERKLFA